MEATESPQDHMVQTLAEMARACIAAADKLELSGKDRETVLAAFLAATLGAPSTTPVVVTGAQPKSSADGVSLGGLGVEGSEPAEKVAKALKCTSDEVGVVFDFSRGEPEIILSARRLPDNKAGATKTIAVLAAAARQALGMEEWTGVEVIRPAVAEYNMVDKSNFAAHISQVDDKIAAVKGSGQSRAVKIHKGGFERVGELVRDLALASGGTVS